MEERKEVEEAPWVPPEKITTSGDSTTSEHITTGDFPEQPNTDVRINVSRTNGGSGGPSKEAGTSREGSSGCSAH